MLFFGVEEIFFFFINMEGKLLIEKVIDIHYLFRIKSEIL